MSIFCSRGTPPREVPGVYHAEAGSYSRLIDSCITQLKAEGPSRTCSDSKGEEEEDMVSWTHLVPCVQHATSWKAGQSPRLSITHPQHGQVFLLGGASPVMLTEPAAKRRGFVCSTLTRSVVHTCFGVLYTTGVLDTLIPIDGRLQV